MEEAHRPTQKEVRANSRSRSAVLFVLRSEKGLPMKQLEKAAAAAFDWPKYPALPEPFSPSDTDSTGDGPA